MSKHIVFSGLDCSGKSTQIEILKNNLQIKGEKNLVFWSRGGYTNGFQKLKDVIRGFSGEKLPKPGFTPEREKALSNPIIRRVWLTIAMIDLFYYYAIYLRIKYFLGYNIICDRYLMDTNIDFKLTYPKNNTDKWVLWRLIEIFALKPDFHFVSTVPVKESVIRSKFKFEPFPDSPEILAQRLELYNKDLKKNRSLIFIDGLRDKNEITTEINNLVNKI
jgi:thymidylate kinase